MRRVPPIFTVQLTVTCVVLATGHATDSSCSNQDHSLLQKEVTRQKHGVSRHGGSIGEGEATDRYVDAYYVNLPEVDNWSQSGELRTEWQKLRIVGTPAPGQQVVEIDLHDWTFATSNGKSSPGHGHSRIEWGATEGCQGAQGTFKINLQGTPFAFPADVPKQAVGPAATGGVQCEGPQICGGTCTGGCGYCGVGHPGEASRVRLSVTDQAAFDRSLTALQEPDMGLLRRVTTWTFDAYYINLPLEDNWSQSGHLKMEWAKLRIAGTPQTGASAVPVDLTDRTYATGNGERMPPQQRAEGLVDDIDWIEWGTTKDCRATKDSTFKINLEGTPFGYPANAKMEAVGTTPRGSVECEDQQKCTGTCGGKKNKCGWCGLGEGGFVKRAALPVVDQDAFDEALHDLQVMTKIGEDFAPDLHINRGGVLPPFSPPAAATTTTTAAATTTKDEDYYYPGEDDDEESAGADPLLIKLEARCGKKGKRLSKKAESVRDCAALAEGAGTRAFIFGKNFLRGYCYAMPVDIDDAYLDHWNKNRANPKCPGGEWVHEKNFDFYAIPSGWLDSAGKQPDRGNMR